MKVLQVGIQSALLVSYTDGLVEFFDLANPLQPTSVGTIQLTNPLTSGALDGTTMVGVAGNSLISLDLADISSPTLIGTTLYTKPFTRVTAGNLLWVGGGPRGFAPVSLGSPLLEMTSPVTVTTFDLAGNRGTGAFESVTFDFTPPQISAVSVAPLFAKSGTTVTISFTMSETVGGDPEVLFGSIPVSKASQSGLDFVYTYTVAESTPQGTIPVLINAADRSGNTISASAGPVQIDSIPPTISNLVVSPGAGASGTIIEISFTVDEPLGMDPTVTLGGRPVSKTGQQGLDYIFSRTLDGTETEGTAGLSITVEDLAANQATDSSRSITTDFTLPVINNVVVSPGIGRVGTQVTVTFTMSEPLAGNPVVTIGGKTTSFVTLAGLQYTYRRTLDGSESEGTAPILINGVDLVGNVGSSLTGTIVTDFTPPVISNLIRSPAIGKVGTLLEATFTVSEPLAGSPIVTMGSTPLGLISVNAGVYVFRRTLDGTEGEGVKTLSITVADPAGNQDVDASLSFTTDFTAPTPTNLSVSPNPAGSGRVVTVTFDIIETLPSPPTVTIGGQAATFVGLSAPTYTFTRQLQGNETEGATTVTIESADSAGNVGNLSIPITLDYTAPTLSGVSASPSGGISGTTILITFTVSEPLQVDPNVTLGGQQATRTGLTNLTYTYERVLDGSETEGTANLLIQVQDPVGNTASNSLITVATDFTAPTVLNLAITPEVGRVGTEVIAQFEASEPLTGTPTVTVGGRPLTLSSQTGLAFSYTRTLDGTETEGPAILSIQLEDSLGNAATDTSGSVSTDFTAPELTLVTVAPETARLATTVQVGFNVSESLVQNPSVTIGSKPATFVSLTGNRYQFSRTLDGSETEETAIVLIEAQDAAGNSTSHSGSSILTDFTAPQITAISVDPDTGRVGTIVQVEFDTSETLAVNPTVIIGGQSATFSALTGNRYRYTRSLDGTETEGAAVVDIQGEDSAGNQSTDASVSMTTDFTAPLFTSVQVEPLAGKSGTAIAVEFDTNEALAQNPTVTVGGQPANFESLTGSRYRFIRTLDGSETEGTASVQIDGADVVGNTTTDSSSTLTTDFTPPQFTAIGIDPDIARAGTVVQVEFDSSEDLTANPSVVIGGKPATFVSLSGSRYRFVRTLDGTEAEGSVTVVITGEDPTGNSAEATEQVSTDFTNPVISSVVAVPAAARSGAVVQVTFTVSESLAQDPIVTLGAVALVQSSQAGLSYTFSRTLDGTETEGADRVVTIQVADPAGNTAEDSSARLKIDFTAPGFTVVSVDPLFATGGTVIVVEIQADEELLAAPVATLGPTAMALQSQSGLNYTYSRPISAADPAGVLDLHLEGSDLAGNTTQETRDGITVDRIAPSASSIDLQPTHARVGSEVTVQFTASESLRTDPVVSIGSVPMTRASQNANTFVFSRTLDGTEPTGDASVTIDLEDLAGNRAQKLAGTVTLDFTDPVVTDASVNPANVRVGTMVTIVFTVSETLNEDPVVTFAGQSTTKQGQAGLTYTYTRTLDGTEEEGNQDGVVQVSDLAGNSAQLVAGTSRVDFQVPVVSSLTMNPGAARSGQTIEATFDVSESLPSSPQVSLQGHAFTLITQAGNSFTFQYTTTGTETEGTSPVSVEVADAAGNSSSANAPISLDFTAPSVASSTVSPMIGRDGTPITVRFKASEPLAQNPAVLLGALAMSFVNKDGLDYIYGRDLTPADGENELPVQVSLEDLVGNTEILTLAGPIPDFTNPTVENIQVDPDHAKAGKTVLVSFTVSEQLVSLPVVEMGGQTFLIVQQQDQTYEFSLTLTGSENQGNSPISIQVEDAAGNTNTDTSGSLVVDFMSPEFSGVSVAPVFASQGTTAIIQFTVSESLQQDPTVTLAGQTLDLVEQVGLAYTYKRILTGTESTGAQAAHIEAVDLAGNLAAQDTPSIIIDFNAPQILSASTTPDHATTGAIVQVEMTLSEPPQSPPTATLAGYEMQLITATYPNYVFSRTITGEESEGVASIVILAPDAAGNDLVGTIPDVVIDYTAPVISINSVSPSLGRTNTVISVSFSISEILNQEPSVVLSGLPMTLDSQSGQTYVFSRVLTGEEEPGEQSIVVSVEDRAGLTAEDSSATVVLDFHAPTLANSTFTPSIIGLGATLAVEFTVSESLGRDPVVLLGVVPLTKVSESGGTFAYERTIGSGDPEGSLLVSVVIEDPAGNSSTIEIGTVLVDVIAPVLSDLAVEPGVARLNTTVNVSFSLSEEPLQEPTVQIANQAATQIFAENKTFFYSRTLDGSETEGDQRVSVEFEDASGNAGSAQAPLRVDFTDPEILGPEVEPTIVGVGMTVYVSFQRGAEVLASDPVVEIGGFPMTFSGSDGGQYLYERTLTGEEPAGNAIVRITVQDEAGNSAVDESLTVEMDYSAPTLESIDVQPALATAGTTVTITFTPSEPIESDPVAFVGDHRAQFVTSSGSEYTIHYLLNGDEGEPTVGIRILVTDRQGNGAEFAAPALRTDFTPPSAVISAYPVPAVEGSPVQFNARGSSDNTQIAGYSWMRNGQLLSQSESFEFSFPDGPGVETVRLEVSDLVGQKGVAEILVPTINASPTIRFQPIPTAISGIYQLEWTATDPGASDSLVIESLILEDMVSGLQTSLIEGPTPLVPGLDWDTRTVPESGYILSIVIKDKDGAVAIARSNPFIVDNAPLVITLMQPAPRVFNPQFGESTQLVYSLSEPGTTTVNLYDSSDSSRRITLLTNEFQSGGTHQVPWDGRINGEIVDGSYAMIVQSTDMRGNLKSIDSSFTPIMITVDTLPPQGLVVDAPRSPTSELSQTLTGYKEPGSGVRVDGTLRQLVDSSNGLSVLLDLSVEGINSFVLQPIDAAGNLGPTTAVDVERDTIPPPAPNVTLPTSPTSQSRLTLSGTKVTESGITLEYKDPNESAYSQPMRILDPEESVSWSTTVDLFVGVNVFRFRAIDIAGNASTPTDVTIDLLPTPIDPLVVNASPEFIATSSHVFTGTKSSGGDVRINGSVVVSYDASTQWTYTYALDEGLNTLEFSSEDSVRNRSETVIREITRDLVDPSIEFTSHSTNQVIGVDPFDIDLTYQDDTPGSGLSLGTLSIQIDGVDRTSEAVVSPATATLSGVELDEGAHSLRAEIRDLAGNSNHVILLLFVQKPDTGLPAKIKVTNVKNQAFCPAWNPYSNDPFPNAALSVQPDQPVVGQVLVFSSTEQLVHTDTILPLLPTQATEIAWDGRNTTGQMLGEGVYTMELRLTNFYGRDSDPVRFEVTIQY